MKRRCKLARTSPPEGLEKADEKFEWPGERGPYPGKVDSEGGERGEGNRSSSRRSLSPCLKAMMVGEAIQADYKSTASSPGQQDQVQTAGSRCASGFKTQRPPGQPPATPQVSAQASGIARSIRSKVWKLAVCFWLIPTQGEVGGAEGLVRGG